MAAPTGKAWRNPRWGSLQGPDADTLQAIFEDLSLWLQNPTFNNGVTVGDGQSGSVNGSGVKLPPSQVTWTAANIGDGITNDNTVPTDVVGLTLTPGVQTILAQWAANTDPDVREGHGTYVVEISTASDFSSILDTHEVGGTSTVFSGLSTGTLYYVRVKARDYSGNVSADWSAVESVEPIEVGAVDIADLSITTAKLANLAVEASKLANGAVEEVKIATDAVSSAKIQAGAVLEGKLADLAVSQAKLAANSVSTAKLVDGAVESVKIATGAITEIKLGTNAVTETKIADDSISTPKIQANAVTANEIAANTITAAEIAANAITASELAANSVVAGKIAAGTIVAADIAADTITASQIAANAITTTELNAGAVTAAKIATNTITANEIAANAITSSELNAGAVVAGKIAAGTIVAADIATNTITAQKLALVSFDNLVQNAGLELSASAIAPFTSGAISTTARSGSHSLRLTAAAAAGDLTYANGTLTDFTQHVPAAEGDQFYFEFWTRRETAGTAPNPIQAGIKFRNRAGSLLASATGSSSAPADATWVKYTVSGTAPAGTAYAVPFIGTAGGAAVGAVLCDDFYMRRMATAELIVDGTITATKIATNTITANEIAANAITADELAANAVTAAKILAGEVQTAALAANAVTAAKLSAVAIEAGKYIRSTTYTAGSAGWTIEADGTAEFNNVVVRGNLAASLIVGNLTMSTGGKIRTSSSGRRLEIATTTGTELTFFTGNGSETAPASITSANVSGVERLQLLGPNLGLGQARISLTHTTGIGIAGAVTLTGGGTGIAALDVSPGSNTRAIWANGAVHVNGVLTAGNARLGDSAPHGAGFAEFRHDDMGTGAGDYALLHQNNGLTYLNCSTGQEIFFRRNNVNVMRMGGTLAIGGGAPDTESLTVTGSGAGVRFRQRSRGIDDNTAAWVIYGTGDQLRFWQGGDFMTFQNVGGLLDWRAVSLPALAGTTLVRSAGNQIGPTSSKRELKTNIRELDGALGRLSELRPVRFNWREGEGMLGNADEINSLHPEGVAGLIIEEVAEVIPDAVHVDADGKPVGFDQQVLMGYLVAAIQELKNER